MTAAFMLEIYRCSGCFECSECTSGCVVNHPAVAKSCCNVVDNSAATELRLNNDSRDLEVSFGFIIEEYCQIGRAAQSVASRTPKYTICVNH